VGIGTSIFLIAVGAILDFALKVQSSAVNLKTVGVILMIVGGIGLVVSLFFWSSWGGFGSYRRTSRVRSAGLATDSYGRVVDPGPTQYVEEERRY
jgi:hypothetical protein